jgi:YHS domain-containing protein
MLELNLVRGGYNVSIPCFLRSGDKTMEDIEGLEKDFSEVDLDPVCGMRVIQGETKIVSIYDGNSYWFCTKACREAFDSNPLRYLKNKSSKRKSWFGRYLERIAKVNKKEFGKGCPKCH